METLQSLAPRLSPAEREELGHLEYLLRELATLRRRQVLPAALYGKLAREYLARKAAIERGGHPTSAPQRPTHLVEAAGRGGSPRLDDFALAGAGGSPASPRAVGAAAARPAQASAAFDAPTAPRPRPDLAAVAREFLQEHWQKLILCLAVLLIVVSSTVGAHHVLGPKLWSPAGKCLLALVYTALFAGLGWGLVRWGAEHAGRMVLLTTLIVLPANFALAGESRLLAQPSALSVLALAFDAAVMLALSRTIVLTIDRDGAWWFTPFFFALAFLNALLIRGMPAALGLTLFLLTTGLFLAGIWALNGRYEGPSAAVRGEFLPLALGLLLYGFLFATLRAGIFVLRLDPALYALPAMAAALVLVQTARHLPATGDRGARLMEHAGLAVAALAFALALSRPPAPSALFSGNMLAMALAGLALFSSLLQRERQPAYLYAAFGALLAAASGASHFLGQVVSPLELAISRALGYPGHLPEAFRSLAGIPLALAAGGLALVFARRWQDARLARHAGGIGLAVSVATCAASCLEPKAALICLGAFAGLYAVAARLFERPFLIYFACGAATGALSAGWLVAGATFGFLALGTALLAVAFWGTSRWLALRAIPEEYGLPLLRSALALTIPALLVAWVANASPATGAILAPAACFLIALLYGLVERERPHPALLYLAVASANAGLLAAMAYGSHLLRFPLTGATIGLAATVTALVQWMLAEVLRRVARDGEGSYERPLASAALVLTVVAVPLAWNSPGTLLLAGLLILLMVRSFPAAGWLYASAAVVARAAYLAWGGGAPDAEVVRACVGAAFLLWALGVAVQERRAALCRTLGLPDLALEYPLFHMACAAALTAGALRVLGTLWQGDPWWAHAVLPAVLAIFCLLMPRAYPWQGWIHGAAALLTLAAAAAAQPWVTAAAGGEGRLALAWLLVGMTLVNGWGWLARATDRLHARTGGWPGHCPLVFGLWATSLFGITAALLAALVAATTSAVVFALAPAAPATRAEWACVLAALALGAVYLRAFRPEHPHTLLHAVLALLIWWLGVPGSPLGLPPSLYLPLATALAGAALALWASRGVGPQGDLLGPGLLVAALFFTRGEPSWTTVLTLALTTAGFALFARARQAAWLVTASAASFAAACAWAALALPGDGAIVPGRVAVGLFTAVYALAAAPTLIRSPNPPHPSDPSDPSDLSDE